MVGRECTTSSRSILVLLSLQLAKSSSIDAPNQYSLPTPRPFLISKCRLSSNQALESYITNGVSPRNWIPADEFDRDTMVDKKTQQCPDHILCRRRWRGSSRFPTKCTLENQDTRLQLRDLLHHSREPGLLCLACQVRRKVSNAVHCLCVWRIL